MSGPTIPGYERLSQIGKGGFSRVYRGEQAKLKRQVAIKVLNFGLSDEADRRSFERECELMGRVSTHPNIVTVHDTAFTESGQPCIVMEHYPGGSIADLITSVGKLQTKEVLEVGVAIAGALEASHQAGIVHCDLKPQNILVSEFGQPALGDFGISTFSEERTRTGSDVGAGFTLAYAAPEIVEGATPTAQSDIYSLAATLYTTLAGRRPFYYRTGDGEKPTAAEQARRILLEDPSSLVDNGVPEQLDDVIRGAMAKDPAQRPASAADFARTLFEVGRRLGYGTSAPRIADQGALSVPGVVDAPVAPEWDPAKQREQLDLTEVRRADQTALRVDMPRPELPAEPPVSTQRRMLAPLIGLGGLLAVVAIVFTVTRGGEPEPVATVIPTPVPSNNQTSQIVAPPAPREVAALRVGADSVLISWTNDATDDVVYEVRLDSRDEPLVATSATSPVIVPVSPDEVPCIDVTAVREPRLTRAPGRRCISPRSSAFIEASPPACALPCAVGLDLTGFEPEMSLELTMTSADSGAAAAAVFDDAAVTDAGGLLLDWEVTADGSTEPGIYLITVTSTDSDAEYHTVVELIAAG